MLFGTRQKVRDSDMWQERTELLLNPEQMDRLHNAHIAVIGLGGVGAYAAEMLARASVGSLLILDSDNVSVSNRNRQLLALKSTTGRPKTEVMAERLLDINPDLSLTIINDYLTPENVEQLLAGHPIDFLVDAIDTLSPKIALIRYCVSQRIPLVSSMGAGAKFDMTKVKIADISKSYNCPLAYIMRKKLRKEGITKGFKVVYSEELPDREAIIPVEETNKKSQVGTISYLPAAFGLACAQTAVAFFI
ncbi:MAG: tRNA threonylcarbamoyladenosine dehydratase [Bacteroidales bacterium]|nr:tRNA threonylcarbamoyladenosine dehydratase [Bacteroidales bacterium]